MRKKTYLSIIFILVLIASILPGCTSYDALCEDLYLGESLFVDGDVTIDGTLSVGAPLPATYPLPDGSAYFDSVVRIHTSEYGMGIMNADYGDNAPLHVATGSFDLTGGAYESLFTSTTPIFTEEDMEAANWIVLLNGGGYTGAIGEIETFVDASNVVLHTAGWDFDLTDVAFAVRPHPIFATGYGGHIHFDVKQSGDMHINSDNYTNGSLFIINLDAAANDICSINSDVDANGNSSVRAICVDYNTGNMTVGSRASLIKIQVDETSANASDDTSQLDFLNFLTTDAEPIEKHAIRVGQGFDNALIVGGGVAKNPSYGYEVTPDVPTNRVTGVAPDGTAFLEASATNVAIFDADNDYILIGGVVTFETIMAVLALGSNRDIAEEYYYSTGAGTWSVLSQENTMNGWQQSGVISWTAPVDWAQTNVTLPAGAAITNGYYIKIIRTRNYVGALPIEDYFKIYATSSTTDFRIRGDGTMQPVHMSDASAPNDSIYYSTTQAKLCYKDSGGTVHTMY